MKKTFTLICLLLACANIWTLTAMALTARALPPLWVTTELV